MKRFFVLATALLALVGCGGNGKGLLPNVSGKAGEVVLVIEKEAWEGNLGAEVRGLLAADCPYLAQREPMFNVVNVPVGNFNNMFKVHRNILILNINPQLTETGTVYRHDVWAHPQAVVQVNAYDEEEALALVRTDGEKLVEFFEQAERDRIIANSIRYEERSLQEPVETLTGGIIHFPSGYKLKKRTADFVWISDDKQYTYQDVLVFRYPATGRDDFAEATLLGHIDGILRDNVPGMFDNTYMTTSEAAPVRLQSLTWRHLAFMQVRGFWEVYNDFMGGPFVAHAFYSRDGRDIIVLYAFVYAPRYDKRQYLRQVESLLYSFEWTGPEDVK